MRDVVARALAEDLGLLGDLTSIAVIDDGRDRDRDGSSPAAEGVLAGTAAATETFAQVDPTVERRVAARTTATRSLAGQALGERHRLAARRSSAASAPR